MAQLGVSREDIAGIGITNQRETTNAELGSRCLVCLSDGRTVFDSAIANGNQKITLQQGQVYILTVDGHTLKFAL